MRSAQQSDRVELKVSACSRVPQRRRIYNGRGGRARGGLVYDRLVVRALRVLELQGGGRNRGWMGDAEA